MAAIDWRAVFKREAEPASEITEATLKISAKACLDALAKRRAIVERFYQLHGLTQKSVAMIPAQSASNEPEKPFP